MSTSIQKNGEVQSDVVDEVANNIDGNVVDVQEVHGIQDDAQNVEASGEVPQIQATRWQAVRGSVVQFLAVIALPFLVIRGVLEFVGVITVYYILPILNIKQPVHPDLRIKHFPDMLWLMWVHFDSGFYLNIAQSGYWGRETLHQMSNWAFFPLYPLLIRIVASPFGTGIDTYTIAALVVSTIASLVACTYLYKLTQLEFGSGVAARAIIYLLLFPLSFYLSAVYPESLFLALSIGSVYYARTRRWWLAGILGGLASLTRPQGVLLLAVVAWEYWQVLADSYAPMERVTGIVAPVQEWLYSRLVGLGRSLASWRTWLGFVALLLIPSGLGLFCVYAKVKVGSFLAFETVEKYGWGRSFTNPISFVVQAFQHPLPPGPADWDFYSLNILVILVFFVLLIPIFRKLPSVYGIFALLFLLMPLTSGELNSISRYYMEIFPVYMLLALWTSRGNAAWSERKHTVIVASFAILLALGMAMFTLGIYSMS